MDGTTDTKAQSISSANVPLAQSANSAESINGTMGQNAISIGDTNSTKSQSANTTISTTDTKAQSEDKEEEKERQVYYLTSNQVDKLEDLRVAYRKATGKRLNKQDFMRYVVDCLDLNMLIPQRR